MNYLKGLVSGEIAGFPMMSVNYEKAIGLLKSEHLGQKHILTNTHMEVLPTLFKL